MIFSPESWQQAWPLIGWTMIYFLAAGTIVLVIGGALRIVFKRANSSVRYATSLAVFAALALLPVAIATYLTSLPRQRGELNAPELTTNYTNDLLNAEVAMASRERDRPERVADERVPARRVVPDPGIPGRDIPGRDDRAMYWVVNYLPWLWLVGTPLTFLLLASGLVGAERLRRSCELLHDGPICATSAELRTALRIGREVGVAICDRIATPLLVGVVRPLILLPPAALTGWSAEELEMVLVHELAHVRRWDNAVNLAQRIVEALLFFHPAVWIASTWVRRDREDCCDAIVVRYTAKPQAYAELLLALASHQPLAGLAMAQHPVAARIRRILKLEDEPMLVSRKTVSIVGSMVLAVALGVVFLGSSDAEEVTTNQASRERQRPEETANQANDTNQELNAEGAKNAESAEIIGVSHEVILERVPVVAEDDPIWRETQQALIKSHLVLSRVISDPKISQLSIMQRAKPNVLAWLSEELSVTYTPDGKMILRLSGPTRDKKELKSVAQAVIRSYLDEREKLQKQLNPLFPTLEEQRAADIAYKLLGVELEKLSEEELKLVKSKGYHGGLRVAQTRAIAENEMPRADSCQYGDLLVGLHVWPTESLEQVTEVLTRDDLDQLSPLKFYVIRRGRRGGRGGFGGATVEDQLITGRIPVDLDSWRAIRKPVLQALVAMEKQLQEELAEKENLRDNAIEKDRAMFDAEIAQLRDVLKTLGQKIAIRTSQEKKTNAANERLGLLAEGPAPPASSRDLLEIDVRMAEKKSEAAKYRYERALEINKRLAGSIPESEVQELKFVYEMAALELERKQTELASAIRDQFTDSPQAMVDPDRYAAEASRESIQNRIDRLKASLNQLTGEELEKAEEELAKAQYQMTELFRRQQEQQRREERERESDQSHGGLLYDGKTFDQWRELWKTELKTENRIECINALAAFGRAGMGQEAAEAILEVAGEYDFGAGEGDSAQKLKSEISQVLTTVGGIPGEHWLPLLIERLESHPIKWGAFAERVLDDVHGGGNTTNLLKRIAGDEKLSPQVRGAALGGVATRPDITNDEEAQGMVREALASADPQIGWPIIENLRFNLLKLFPEQMDWLFHDNEQIRNQASMFLMQPANSSNGPAILDVLLKVINDPARKKDHPAAISALQYLNEGSYNTPELRKRRNEAIVKFGHILVEGDPELLPTAVATMSALTRLPPRQLVANGKEKLGNKITEERRKQLEQAIVEAEELQSKGGRGGMGGGGGGFF